MVFSLLAVASATTLSLSVISWNAEYETNTGWVKDAMAEAKEADVVAVCLQELGYHATVADFGVDSVSWELAAKAELSTATKPGRLLQNKDAMNKVGLYLFKRRSKKIMMHRLEMKAKTWRMSRFDRKKVSKGGALAVIDVYTPQGTQTVALACAHIPTVGQDQGIKHMVKAAEKMHKKRGFAHPATVIIAGDLNFRLRQRTPSRDKVGDWTVADLLTSMKTAEGRCNLMEKYDQIDTSTALSKEEGWHCGGNPLNFPSYKRFLPKQKRFDTERIREAAVVGSVEDMLPCAAVEDPRDLQDICAKKRAKKTAESVVPPECQALAAMQSCEKESTDVSSPVRNHCSEWRKRLERCFFGKRVRKQEEKGVLFNFMKPAEKHGGVQLGWLDRTCIKPAGCHITRTERDIAHVVSDHAAQRADLKLDWSNSEGGETILYPTADFVACGECLARRGVCKAPESAEVERRAKLVRLVRAE